MSLHSLGEWGVQNMGDFGLYYMCNSLIRAVARELTLNLVCRTKKSEVWLENLQ